MSVMGTLPSIKIPSAFSATSAVKKRSGGFTLVEILLVAFIIGMAASIAIPAFVNSMKGARLRTSVRAVMAMNRYARSMAIMQQKQVVLRYHLEDGKLEMGMLDRHSYARPMRSMIDSSAMFGGGEEADQEQAGHAATQKSRELEPGIVIEDFVGGDGQEFEGGIWVSYYPNGMCDEHSFRLMDEDGDQAVMGIAGLTGELSLEMILK